METIKNNANGDIESNLQTPLKKIDAATREKLRVPFPDEVIKQHPDIPLIYLVERLNDVFGVGRWTFEHQIVKETETSLLVKGKLILLDYNSDLPYQYGSHSTSRYIDLADSYSNAVATAMMKCAGYLEIGIDRLKGEVIKPTQPDNNVTTPIKVNLAVSPLSPEIRKKHFIQDCQHCQTSTELLEIKKAYQDLIKTDVQVENIYAKFETALLIRDSFRGCKDLAAWDSIHKKYERYHEVDFYAPIAFEKYRELLLKNGNKGKS